MYLLHFKGIIDPIEIQDSEADALKYQLLQPKNSERFVEIKERLFRLSTIKSLAPLARNNSDREPAPEKVILSQAQITARERILNRTKEELREKGVLGFKSPRNVKEGLPWYKECQVCGKELPKGLRRVCSGECYEKSPTEV